jgi:hypothetical protein
VWRVLDRSHLLRNFIVTVLGDLPCCRVQFNLANLHLVFKRKINTSVFWYEGFVNTIHRFYMRQI